MHLKKIISYGLIVTMISGGLLSFAHRNHFIDIDNHHWAKPMIYQWADAGFIKGYPDHSFKPTNTVSLAEFLQLIDNVVGLEYVKDSSYEMIKLQGINKDDWYYDVYLKSLSAHLISMG